MSTDYQKAREDLGIRLRELRLSAPGGRLTGTALAGRLGPGWTKVKVSKLENGRQTATAEDLRAWADGTGQPQTYEELLARLRGFESHIRSWRRQLAAGHRAVQDAVTPEHDQARVLTIWENCLIPGMLQTPDYARYTFYDERLVVVEDWHAELWLDDADSVALYLRTWQTLRESAVYGPEAHNLINAARRALNVR
ncbi:helix-turn-helix domain-containing protein [Streptomyces sp. NPDC004673]